MDSEIGAMERLGGGPRMDEDQNRMYSLVLEIREKKGVHRV
jgi:hypothetical protein